MKRKEMEDGLEFCRLLRIFELYMVCVHKMNC